MKIISQRRILPNSLPVAPRRPARNYAHAPRKLTINKQAPLMHVGPEDAVDPGMETHRGALQRGCGGNRAGEAATDAPLLLRCSGIISGSLEPLMEIQALYGEGGRVTAAPANRTARMVHERPSVGRRGPIRGRCVGGARLWERGRGACDWKFGKVSYWT